MRLRISAVAAVALVATTCSSPSHRAGDDGPLGGLAAAWKGDRSINGRLTGGFLHSTRGMTRSSDPLGGDLEFVAEAGRVQQRALRTPDARSLHAWGAAQLLLGTVDEAVSSLETAALLDPASAEIQSDLAVAYLNRAQQQRRAGDWAQALEAAERALALDPHLREVNFNRGLILEALHLRAGATDAWSHYLVADPDSGWAAEARRYLDALHRAEQLPDPEPLPPECRGEWSDGAVLAADQAVLAWARRQVGSAVNLQIDSAVTTWAVCLSEWLGEHYFNSLVAAAAQNPRETAKSVLVLDRAESARTRANLAEAAAIASTLQHLPQHHPVGVRASWILCSRLYNDGRIEEARTLMSQLLRAATEQGYQSIRAQVAGGLAAVYFSYNDFDESLIRFGEAVKTYETLRFAQGLSSTSIFAADAARALGDYDTAWELFLKAFAHERWLTSVSRRHAIFASPMIAALAQGLPRVSLRFAEAALARAQVTGNAVHRCEIGHTSARAMVRIGRTDEAREVLAAAALHCDRIDDPGLKTRSTANQKFALANVLLASDPNGSETAAEEALALFQRAGWQYLLPQVFQMVGAAQRGQHRLNDASESFGRGITLVEAYEADVSNRERRIAFVDGLWDLYGDQIKTLIDLGNTAAAFEAADRGVARSMRSATPESVLTLQSRLRPGEVLLQSVVTDDRLLLFAMTQEQLHKAETPITKERVSQAARWLSLSLATPDRVEQSKAAARTLSEFLLLPFAGILEQARVLYIVPDPLLQSVPYSLLPVNKVGREVLLVDRLPSVMCPSASVCLGGSGGVASASVSTVAIFRQRSGQPLPRLDWEVSEIAKLYSKARVADATAALVKAELRRADILHYAGHAFVDPGVSQRSSLLMPKDDRSPATQVPVTDLIADKVYSSLVVLSACSTLRGRQYRGEGMVAASTLFLSRGALNVVGTLWDVRDDAASTLMVEFHRQLARGYSPAVALWFAQRQQRGEARPPRDWAYPVLVTRDTSTMRSITTAEDVR